MNIIRLIFPFLLLVVFFCLYKKEYHFMKQFQWGMAMFHNARMFYVSILLIFLISINWCCCITQPNVAVALTSIITLLLLKRKYADRILHRLHESKRLWAVTVLLALINYAIPYMNSVFHLLFTISVAAVFYPSEKVLRLKDEIGDDKTPSEMLDIILKNYY